MAPQIFLCDQNSPDWYEARRGLATASEFECIVKRLKSGGVSEKRQTYMFKLAGERLTGDLTEQVFARSLERGKTYEEEARDGYSFLKNTDVQIVGFVRNEIAGCSPDGLVGTDGGVEIKVAQPHIQIERLLTGGLPEEHKAQVQGNLWITEREWWDFTSYCPKLPQLIVRVTRDNGYIANLAGAVAKFNEELAETVEKIKSYGEPKPTVKDQLIASVKATGFDPEILMAG